LCDAALQDAKRYHEWTTGYRGYRANNATNDFSALTFELKGAHKLLNADAAGMLRDRICWNKVGIVSAAREAKPTLNGKKAIQE
jgi:hypothetical protein